MKGKRISSILGINQVKINFCRPNTLHTITMPRHTRPIDILPRADWEMISTLSISHASQHIVSDLCWVANKEATLDATKSGRYWLHEWAVYNQAHLTSSVVLDITMSTAKQGTKWAGLWADQDFTCSLQLITSRQYISPGSNKISSWKGDLISRPVLHHDIVTQN